MSRLEEAARGGSLVIFAGAGVSASLPTALPGWKPLNAAVFRALRLRLEAGLRSEDWLVQLESWLESERRADRFPPDYQAQVIEEMCGERYFRALQALDVDVQNSAHAGIAGLAAAGAVRAILTTNFDRLIERSLDRSGIAYEVAYNMGGYCRLRDRLRSGKGGPLPVIKIHGCVSDHLSMIDTLKQRRRGRSRAIEECLEPLHSGYWLYLGFSAADLETDRNYLDLVKGASRSCGATYLGYPGSPNLGMGAQTLMAAYGEAGAHVVAEIGSFLLETCRSLQIPKWTEEPVTTRSGRKEFEERLAAWASALSLAATGLCLAAVLEAAGQSDSAARILDRLARKEIYEERGTADFQALQLQYGRLGAAFGRFINVPDLAGVVSNASVEAVQSLLRLNDTDLATRALAWMPCLHLWLNDGKEAMVLAGRIMRGFILSEWEHGAPQSDEEAVDAWLAATLVFLVDTHANTYGAIVGTFQSALDRAKRSGDVVRTARVVALSLLAKAEIPEDVPALAKLYRVELDDVRRVGDGFAMGFWALAHGRWHTGLGGIALARQTNSREKVARRALEYLDEAIVHFRNQGMDPWCLFAEIQRAKALTDLRDLESVKEVFNRVQPELDRFQAMSSYVLEARGQIETAISSPEAATTLRKAIAMAEQSGLRFRHKFLVDRYWAAGTDDLPAVDD